MYIALYFVSLVALVFLLSTLSDFICSKLNVIKNKDFYLWRTKPNLIVNIVISLVYVIALFIPAFEKFIGVTDIMVIMFMGFVPEIYCCWMIWNFIEFKNSLNGK